MIDEDFFKQLNTFVRPYIGGAYGVFSQQHVSTEPETFYYLQLNDTEHRWEPISDTFNSDSLPMITEWVKNHIEPGLPEGWQVRIVKTEMSIVELDPIPAEVTTEPLISAAAEA
jgi:hypothetical protein